MGGGGDPNIGVLWGLNKAHTGNGGVKCWGRSQRDPKIRLLWGQNEAQKVNGVGGGRGTPMLGLWGALNWSYRGNGREYGGGGTEGPQYWGTGGPSPTHGVNGRVNGRERDPDPGPEGRLEAEKAPNPKPSERGEDPKTWQTNLGGPKRGGSKGGAPKPPPKPSRRLPAARRHFLSQRFAASSPRPGRGTLRIPGTNVHIVSILLPEGLLGIHKLN